MSRIKKRIDNSLIARQNIVGGCIAIFSLTDAIDIIHREDFTNLDKQNPWMIYNEQVDEPLILYGTILCLRYQKNDYISLKSDNFDTINALVIPISVFNSHTQKMGNTSFIKNANCIFYIINQF